jgi:MraZ protein
MFEGTYALSLDLKGRMTIPTKLRATFADDGGDTGRVVITRHPDGCLMLFKKPDWVVKREALARLPQSARAFVRIFVGSAQEVELDGSGRVLIPPDLRKIANLEKDVELVGMLTYYEIWDATARATNEDKAIAEGMPEALQNFSF